MAETDIARRVDELERRLARLEADRRLDDDIAELPVVVDSFAGETMLEVTEAASRFGLSEDTIRFWARTYNCGKKDVVTGRWLVSVERIKARINSRKRR
ncbi:MerR family transcriptional regulator [Mesorhizobium sp.]|uniref:MerR family transcriptional regulator n=1 Tax=Mesorhizobium sp. TaxID=1871066 RepID=UPI000FE6658E|nr:MerR family transcriptional regulator [Mesorhizobium sp.]RWQ54340.1 MAG: hypothetical protein EOS84_13615 [Mesorhizobium sp.]